MSASTSASVSASGTGSTSKPTARAPPAYFDGRPHFLDTSYTRVEQFDRKRPGGRRTGNDNKGSVDSDADSDEEQSASDSSDSESEYEYTYEDLPPQLVIFDLGPDSKRLTGNEGSSRGNSSTTQGQWSITGLETDGPMLKVGNVVFRGEWTESIGTGIVLEDVRDPTRPFPNQHHPHPLASPLPSTTHDVIRFRQVVNSHSESKEAAVRVLANKSKFKEEAVTVRFADEEQESSAAATAKKRAGRKRLTPMQKTQRAIEKALRADTDQVGTSAKGQGPLAASRVRKRLEAMQREEEEARRFLQGQELGEADAVLDEAPQAPGVSDNDEDDGQRSPSPSSSSSASVSLEDTETATPRGRGRGRGRPRGRGRGLGRGRGRGRGRGAATTATRTHADGSDSDVEMTFDQEVDREAAIRAAQQQQQQQQAQE